MDWSQVPTRPGFVPRRCAAGCSRQLPTLSQSSLEYRFVFALAAPPYSKASEHRLKLPVSDQTIVTFDHRKTTPLFCPHGLQAALPLALDLLDRSRAQIAGARKQ